MSPGNLMAVMVAAFVTGALGTALMRRLALRIGMVDEPTPVKDHARATPLLGGLAIYLAVVVALLLNPDRRELVQLTAILVAASWVSFWGLWDDRRGLRPYLKLLAQIAAAGIVMVSGIQVSLPIPAWANIALTVVWIVGITNAFNLLDHTDGLAGGIGAIAAAYFLLMAAMNEQMLVGPLAAAILGACLAFLLFNFNPARIFMGDSGSLFLGFTMAVLGIKLRFPANVNWVTWMVPVLVLGVPIFDTTLVVVSRLRRGSNPLTTPGTDHVAHRLTRLGWTRREAVLGLYVVGCGLGGLSLFVSLADAAEAYVIASMVALLVFAALYWLERSPRDEPR